VGDHADRRLGQSLFYRTVNGAKVGDRVMSRIHTAKRHQVEPLDDRVALLRRAGARRLDAVELHRGPGPSHPEATDPAPD
jgi:hypothetical protein